MAVFSVIYQVGEGELRALLCGPDTLLRFEAFRLMLANMGVIVRHEGEVDPRAWLDAVQRAIIAGIEVPE